MKKKRSVLKDLLFVSISSFIVVVAWIAFNLYHTWVTTTLTPEMQVTITAINPDFDAATIKKLKVRKQVTPINTLSGKVTEEPTTTPSPAALPVATTPSEEGGVAILPTPTTTAATGTGAEAQPQVSNIPVTVNGE